MREHVDELDDERKSRSGKEHKVSVNFGEQDGAQLATIIYGRYTLRGLAGSKRAALQIALEQLEEEILAREGAQ